MRRQRLLDLCEIGFERRLIRSTRADHVLLDAGDILVKLGHRFLENLCLLQDAFYSSHMLTLTLEQFVNVLLDLAHDERMLLIGKQVWADLSVLVDIVHELLLLVN